MQLKQRIAHKIKQIDKSVEKYKPATPNYICPEYKPKYTHFLHPELMKKRTNQPKKKVYQKSAEFPLNYNHLRDIT